MNSVIILELQILILTYVVYVIYLREIKKNKQINNQQHKWNYQIIYYLK